MSYNTLTLHIWYHEKNSRKKIVVSPSLLFHSFKLLSFTIYCHISSLFLHHARAVNPLLRPRAAAVNTGPCQFKVTPHSRPESTPPLVRVLGRIWHEASAAVRVRVCVWACHYGSKGPTVLVHTVVHSLTDTHTHPHALSGQEYPRKHSVF